MSSRPRHIPACPVAGCGCATSLAVWRATLQQQDAAAERSLFSPTGIHTPPLPLPKKGRTGIRTQTSAIFQAICSPGRPIAIGLCPFLGSESNPGPSPQIRSALPLSHPPDLTLTVVAETTHSLDGSSERNSAPPPLLPGNRECWVRVFRVVVIRLFSCSYT